MTTAAYDLTHLAADRRLSIGDTPLPIAQKILPFQHDATRYLVAIAGKLGHAIELLRHHFTAPRVLGQCVKAPDNLDCTLLLVCVEPGKRRALILTCDGSEHDVTHRCWALGSGCDYALGAMAFGATALEAVRIASVLDKHTGDGVQVEHLATWERRPLADFPPLLLPLASMPTVGLDLGAGYDWSDRSYNWTPVKDVA